MKTVDDILNINVGGKKYTATILCQATSLGATFGYAGSKLATLFRPNSNKPMPIDKGGNIYLNRDPKTFRDILTYLRMKNERFVSAFALPCKPDDLAKLVAECEALNLVELRDAALEMLQKYQRTDEQHYVTSYVQDIMKSYESWQFERDQNLKQSPTYPLHKKTINSSYDEWENM